MKCAGLTFSLRSKTNDAQEVQVMSDTIPEYVLNDGLKLPAIGLGTYRLNGREGA